MVHVRTVFVVFVEIIFATVVVFETQFSADRGDEIQLSKCFSQRKGVRNEMAKEKEKVKANKSN